MSTTQKLFRFFEYVYAVLLGIFFGYAAFGLLAIPLIFLMEESFTKHFYLSFVSILAFIVWMVYLCRKKTFFYQAMLVNKAKIRTSLLLMVLWLLVMLTFPEQFYNFSLQMLPLNALFLLLLIYPFVALFYHGIEKGWNRKLIAVTILINPIFLIVFMGLGIILAEGLNENALTEPCGVTVIEVTQGSPAENAGLQTGDVITSLDGHLIKEVDDIVNYNNSFSMVVTNRGSFSVNPELEDGQYRLGIRVQQERCDKY